MDRLSRWDAMHLNVETAVQVSNVVSLHKLGPISTSFEGFYRIVEAELMARIELCPRLTQHLFAPWYRFGEPLWRTDAKFDVRNHVRTMPMPEPGGLEGARHACERLLSERLDRDKPLWDIWLLEDPHSPTDPNEVFAIWRAHHALMDGTSGPIIGAGLGVEDPGNPVELKGLSIAVQGNEVSPNWRSIVANGLHQKVARIRYVPYAIAVLVRARSISRKMGLSGGAFGASWDRQTPLNTTVTAERRVAFLQLPVDEVRVVAENNGATINDVLLCCVGGALRRALGAQGWIPDKPLSTAMVVGVQSVDQGKYLLRSAFSAGTVFVSLCDDISDPASRLSTVHRHTSAAKERQRRLGVNVFRVLTEYVPGWMFKIFIRVAESGKLAERMRPFCNATVSYFRKFPELNYFLGIPVLAEYPIGPLQHGTGVNITACQRLGSINIAIHACANQSIDPEFFVDELNKEFIRLKECVVDADSSLSLFNRGIGPRELIK